MQINNPFSKFFKRRKKNMFEYIDYDTDEDEEYDDVLPYLKGRKEY